MNVIEQQRINMGREQVVKCSNLNEKEGELAVGLSNGTIRIYNMVAESQGKAQVVEIKEDNQSSI